MSSLAGILIAGAWLCQSPFNLLQILVAEFLRASRILWGILRLVLVLVLPGIDDLISSHGFHLSFS